MRFLIYSLIFLSPLPFASARPVWQWVWVCYIGIVGIAMFVRTYRTDHWLVFDRAILWAICFLCLFVLWGVFQATVSIHAEVDEFNNILASKQVVSMNPYRTLSTTVFFIAHIVFFLCVFTYCQTTFHAVRLVRFIGITIFLYAAYGFIVYASGNESILWYKKWAYLDSLTSTFVNRNSFAAYCGLGLISLLAYIFYWIQQSKVNWRSFLGSHAMTQMCALSLAVVITVTSLVLTASRAGFASVAIAVFALLAIGNNIQGGGSYWRQIFFGALILGFFMVLINISGENLSSRLANDTSFNVRLIAYSYIINAIFDNPLMGYGLGTFENVFPFYRGEGITIVLDRAHNDYLELVLAVGFPASIAFLTAVLLISYTLISCLKYGKQYKSIIAVGLAVIIQLALHSLVDFSLQIPAVSYAVVALVATSLAVAVRCRSEEKI